MDLLFAYFDPSAGSLLLQALVGGFGGIAVVGRYLWMQFLGQRTTPSVMSNNVMTSTVLSNSQEIQIPFTNQSR